MVTQLNKAERRNNERFAIDLRLQIMKHRNLTGERVCNISPGGVGVSTCFPMSRGSKLTMKVPLSAAMPLKIEGEVVWATHPDKRGEKGRMGVRFVELSKDAQEQLRRYLMQSHQNN